MKTFIENLCGKLEDWGIDPLTLLKAIGIFLLMAILVILIMSFPKLFGILLIIVFCVVSIALIYLMLSA